MTAPVVEVRDFTFAIEGHRILDGVSMAAGEGRHLSVVGPNGAGKTTLLKCLLRVLAGGSGEIRVAGRRLEDYTQLELARVVSYVPQPGGGAFPFTVGEFVGMSRYAHLGPFGSLRSEDRRAVERSLALTGMTGFVDRQMATLSGGERQEVLIAAALAQDARVMLLDEPTAFLDYRHQVSIRSILRQVRAAGTSIIAVTHDVNSALLAGDEVLALREGRVVHSGPAAGLGDPEVLRGIYGIDFAVSENPATGRVTVAPREAP